MILADIRVALKVIELVVLARGKTLDRTGIALVELGCDLLDEPCLGIKICHGGAIGHIELQTVVQEAFRRGISEGRRQVETKPCRVADLAIP